MDLRGHDSTGGKTGNDPRPSLDERHGGHAGYARRVRHAAKRPVAGRLLLDGDADALIAKAKSEETAGH